jgi:uncharacterized protein (DUF697 family)
MSDSVSVARAKDIGLKRLESSVAKYCTLCGREAKENAKFCSGCGSRYAASANPPVSSPPPRQPSQPPQAAYPPHSGGFRDETPPPIYQPPTSSAGPPQFWESYDYDDNTNKSPQPGYEYPSTSSGFRPPDASRPLPSLSFDAPASPNAARDRAREIARNFSLWAAGIVLFPIPFSDLVLLMPIQTAMVIYIGKAYGVKDPPEKTLAHIAAACGASVFGQITTLFVTNLIPIIGKMVSAPFVYGWTYGLGEVAIRYFEMQGEISQDEMKDLFKQVSKQATRAFNPVDIKQAGSLDKLKDHLSEEDYRKLRARFSQS